MCGIAGILTRSAGGEHEAVVRSMVERLERRGPDDSGIERHGDLTLGNRRLAILDLSAAGHQPMRSASGRYVISFNGEIYNHRDLREELQLEPAQLRSSSDTEILLAAWERWGPETPHRLVGPFAFAIWDRDEQVLWLVRDRFGEKPLFWHRSQDALTFASTLPALLQAPWVPRELDPECIDEYLSLRYVVAPRTILRDVRKLPGGRMLRATSAGLEELTWWDLRYRPDSSLAGGGSRAIVDEFGALLTRASRRCLESDRPVALLLSDGIDSNAVRAALRRDGRELRCFTYRMSDATAALLPIPGATHDGAEVVDVVVGPEERIGAMQPAFSAFSEPVGDGAALATWLLLRRIRDQATVFLCGHGADEVLGGYRLSQDRFRLAFISRFAWLPLVLTWGAYDRFVYGPERAGQKRAAIRAAAHRLAPAVGRYLIHKPLRAGDLEMLRGKPVTSYLDTIDRLYGDCGAEASDLDRIMEVLARTFLEANIVNYADSVAGDWSVELRMPFLDRDLVNFILRLPERWRVSRWPGVANTKVVMRQWGRECLDPDILTRRKRSFNFGNLPSLLRSDRGAIQDFVLGSDAVRSLAPGAEAWLAQPPELFRKSREGTLWALIALGIWCTAHGVR